MNTIIIPKFLYELCGFTVKGQILSEPVAYFKSLKSSTIIVINANKTSTSKEESAIITLIDIVAYPSILKFERDLVTEELQNAIVIVYSAHDGLFTLINTTL